MGLREAGALLGIAMAPRQPQTTERIAVLRDDPMETPRYVQPPQLG
ncbi:hypothetical protein [Streptomyces virginiae]|uniref:Transposase n=1 Tax=Streptomyces virginiae TaxID=1961 RepID=A0ABZ1TNG4_STRVG|nr:hypothetical protein [Streptomyces virginiae]